MTTADTVLGIARSYKGVTENPPGSNLNPFAALAGQPNGYAWCASFVVAVFRQAGMKLPSESAWTPTMAQGFRNAGAWHQGADGATPGDVLFWDFPDKEQGIEHVSICVSPPAGGLIGDIGGTRLRGRAAPRTTAAVSLSVTTPAGTPAGSSATAAPPTTEPRRSHRHPRPLPHRQLPARWSGSDREVPT
jgi:hypothetical protein